MTGHIDNSLIELPYGTRTLQATVPTNRVCFTGEFEEMRAIDDFVQTLRWRLERPTAGPALSEIAKGRNKALVLVDDNTRPTPVHKILPELFDCLNAAGLPDSRIEILTAGGTHRLMTDAELLTKVGEEVARRVRISQHDFRDQDAMVRLEPISVGGRLVPIEINRKVLEADLVVGLGSIFPHSDAGFTGGAKIVQPGVCGPTTTAGTHIAAALLDDIPLGVPENPCRLGMERVARAVGLDFIINVVQSPGGVVFDIVSGDVVQAHRSGVEISRRAHGVHVPKAVDVVIVSSSPEDIDWWQAEKALVAAYFAVRPGGIIVLAAECREGLVHNHPQLAHWAAMEFTEACERARRTDLSDMGADLIAADVAIANARIREKASIIIVTDGLSNHDCSVLGYERMPDLQRAVDVALDRIPQGTIGILPYGGVCLPILAGAM